MGTWGLGMAAGKEGGDWVSETTSFYALAQSETTSEC